MATPKTALDLFNLGITNTSKLVWYPGISKNNFALENYEKKTPYNRGYSKKLASEDWEAIQHELLIRFVKCEQEQATK